MPFGDRSPGGSPSAQMPTRRGGFGSAYRSGGGSIYATPGSSGGKGPGGGSIYATRGGFGSARAPVPQPTPAKPKGGGLFGAIGGGAHWLAQKGELAGRDIKQMPAGLYQLGKDIGKAGYADIRHPLRLPTAKNDPLSRDIKAMGRATAQTVEHPLRDPFQTALTVLPLVTAGFGAAARAGEAAGALRTGEGAAAAGKALLRKPPLRPRLIQVGDEQVALHASRNPAVRAAQAVYDTRLQKAVNERPESRLAAHAAKRVGGAISETGRMQARMRAVPAQQLAKAAKRLGGRQRVEQAALELTSVNTTPERAAAYHLGQAAKGVEPALNRAAAKLYSKVGERRMLTMNKDGDVIVNADEHPRLALADVRLADVQGRGDEILARYGQRTVEQLQARVNAPGRIRAGGTFGPKAATVERLRVGDRVRLPGRESGVLTAVDRSSGIVRATVYDKAAGKWGEVSYPADQLDVRTGGQIAGGETARPGRGFVSYATSEPRAPRGPAAVSAGPVVGEARTPITSKAFTGAGVERGLVPKDVTGQAARHYQQIVRFVNTSEHRAAAVRAGTDARRSSRDVLVKIPGAEHEQIPAAVSEILGKAKLTSNDLEGVQAALNAYREELVPGLRNRFARDRALPIGTSAEEAAKAVNLPTPKGYRWVDRNVLGDLGHAGPGPRGPVTRVADRINSAVTAATVYFKIGHVGTRVFTNATTNLIQGSLQPVAIGHAVRLWHALSDTDKMRALAAAGQHGFEALPHEGVGVTARVAGAGARWWAKHADAPFRFNSIAFEARKAGYGTPARFGELLDRLERPHAFNMNAAEQAKVQWVANRANRAAIAYDRLGETERRFLTRAIWFYPWVKGASMFLGHTIVEHPYKSFVGGQAGVQGRERQARELGPLPSYEGGLFKVGGGQQPLVTDLSTFSPFATPADLLDVAARPAQASGLLNPVYTAGTNLIFGLNQFGGKSRSPVKDALASLAAPTPEAQLVEAYLNRRKDQSRRMFPKSPALAGTRDPLLRALLGPAVPRRLNLRAARSAAAREISGR
jgi:hypothetical protein